MAFSYEEQEKLSADGEDFLAKGWALIEGDNGPMAASNSLSLVAKNDNAIVGALKGWTAGGVGYVSELMVAPEWRSGGIGSELLKHFEAACRKGQNFVMALQVESDGRARNLYEREGWKVELIIPRWLGDHEYVQMRKYLDS